MLVNGVIWPDAEVARGLYRLRMVNAASFSNWMLHLSRPLAMWVIGMEGGLLPVPARVDHFRLGPGERADVLVDFSTLAPGETVELLNSEEAAPQAAQIGAVDRTAVVTRLTIAALPLCAWPNHTPGY